MIIDVFQFCFIGRVAGIEANHKPVEMAREGQEVCIKVLPTPGEAPRMLGRHFDTDDQLVSKVSYFVSVFLCVCISLCLSFFLHVCLALYLVFFLFSYRFPFLAIIIQFTIGDGYIEVREDWQICPCKYLLLYAGCLI